MMQTISLAMIVRDEEANLAKCLNSALQQVDEIVIVDTGSRDQTVAIAQKFTPKIYHYPWNGDFSAARNFAISKCSGQWILCLDADETLDVERGSIKQLIKSSSYAEAFFLPLFVHSFTGFERFLVIRLFRNNSEYRFVGKIHEQIRITKPNIVGIGDGPVIVHEFINPKQRNKKRYRNLQLLKQALNNDPDNCYLRYYLGVEWLGIGQYEKALPHLQAAAAKIPLDQLIFRGSAVRYLVDCLKFLERLDDALKVCQDECKVNPDYTDIFFEVGAILEEQGNFIKAIEYFHKAIELGEPPLWFYHSKGTESFLALYHLGFCYEKIGCREKAEQYYWQALDENPHYTCPLYSLFLLKVTQLPASSVFDYFCKKNSLVLDQWVETLAMLFFESDLPELSANCYEQSLNVGRDKGLNRIKSLLYSGRVQEALDSISGMEKSEVTVEITTEEILAHILKGNYSTAKQRALALWANSPASRSQAWVLLAIIARSSCSAGYTRPELSREPAVIQAALSILKNCLRFTGNPLEMTWEGAAFRKLTTTIISLLAESSAESNRCLSDFWLGKAGEVRSLLEYNYGWARGLYI